MTPQAGTSPTPHLLLTNDSPTESERILIQTSINEAQVRRGIVFETTRPQLLSAKPDRRYLENLAELLSLDEFIYNHQSLLSPLRYFPPELLAEILSFTNYERFFQTDRCVAVQEPDYQYILGLSHVSRYWRRVAVTTQRLWTSIPALVKLRSNSPEPESLLQLLRIFIERSGNDPIHITVFITHLLYDRLGAPLESPCLDLLASHCHRWKSAILNVDISIVKSLVKLDAPILDSFNFRYRYRLGWITRSWPQLLVVAPRLKHVIVDSWQWPSFLQCRWSQISTFAGLPVDLEIMRPTGPNLKTCTFRGPISRMNYPTEPIHFDQLTFLSIENTHYFPPNYHFGQEFDTPFRWIASPNLEVLFVKGHHVYSGASLVVRDLLLTTLPSSSLLSILHFYVRGLTEDDFKALLLATPLLENLSICDTPSSYFSHLIRGDLHHPLVPNLKLLEIQNFSDSDAAPLVALCNSCQVKGQPVEFLSISLSYSSARYCLQAQNRLEGWDERLRQEWVPGSELNKVLGWATFVAKQFLGRCGKAEQYGFVPKPFYGFQPPFELDPVLKLIEQYQFSDPKIIEISHLREMMMNVAELSYDDLPKDVYNFQGRAADLVFTWSIIHPRWRPTWSYFHKTLRLCSTELIPTMSAWSNQ